jgi:hypothetical protein
MLESTGSRSKVPENTPQSQLAAQPAAASASAASAAQSQLAPSAAPALSFSALEDIIAGPLEEYERELATAITEIRRVEIAAPPAAPPPQLQIAVDHFDESSNVLNDGVCENFVRDIRFEDGRFTNPMPTTITLEGFISNVKFHESGIMEQLSASIDCVVIVSNYGRRVYPGYTEPRARNSGRGRKKREKVRKQRKIQGDGSCFNSQVSFAMRPRAARVYDAWDGGYGGRSLDLIAYWLVDNVWMYRAERAVEPATPNALASAINEGDIDAVRELVATTPLVFAPIIPSDTKLYKFKVFRTGRIQLPGARPDVITDVIHCARTLAGIMNRTLHAGDPVNASVLININPVMKNYKFALRMGSQNILDLGALKQVFVEDRPRVHDTPFVDVRFTREDTKLSVLFRTPIRFNPEKTTRVNIFMSGKVNILGAYDDDTTRRICGYLARTVAQHPECIVNARGVRSRAALQRVDLDAILEAGARELRAVAERYGSLADAFWTY